MRNRNNVTESSVEKAKLTPNEAKVIRVFYNLEAAGSKKSRTRKFVENLSAQKHELLLESGLRKIRETLDVEKAY